jgi:hypothetical protein
LAGSGPCESLSYHYKARDAYLAKSASAEGTMNVDPASLANAAALACTAEIDKLIEVMNCDGDPRVAARMQKDSEFRAMGCVMKARLEAKRRNVEATANDFESITREWLGNVRPGWAAIYHGDTALMPGNLSLMGATEGVE